MQSPESDVPITLSIPTVDEWKTIQDQWQRGQTLRNQNMNLHWRPLAEFVQWSVAEKRQALIEWQLQFEPVCLDEQQLLLWSFTAEQSASVRASAVQRYEAHIDQWRDRPALEWPEMKTLVSERKQALQEALLRLSPLSLHELLSQPGCERFTLLSTQVSTAQHNAQTFKIQQLQAWYPKALLYHLFNQPPAYLQRTETLISLDKIPETLIPAERERLFATWLTDSAQSQPDGWLTLERVNDLNNFLKPATKVFRPKNRLPVTAGTVKPLVKLLQQYPQYRNRIEARPRQGKAWRWTDWETIR